MRSAMSNHCFRVDSGTQSASVIFLLLMPAAALFSVAKEFLRGTDRSRCESTCTHFGSETHDAVVHGVVSCAWLCVGVKCVKKLLFEKCVFDSGWHRSSKKGFNTEDFNDGFGFSVRQFLRKRKSSIPTTTPWGKGVHHEKGPGLADT